MDTKPKLTIPIASAVSTKENALKLKPFRKATAEDGVLRADDVWGGMVFMWKTK